MQPLPMAKKDEEKGFSFYMPFMRAFGLGAPKGMSPITEKNEVLKVSFSRKGIMLSWILPKNKRRISALAYKERSNQKNKGTLLY